MFTEETVLVLGAGASVHYGYPTGDELITNIKQTITSTEFVDSTYGEPEGFYLNDQDSRYKELNHKLDFFDPLSIDTFLMQNSNNKQLVDAGKDMIAYEILKNEDPEKLKSNYRYRGEIRGNWYRFLLHSLFAKRDDEAFTDTIADLTNTETPLNLKIITFNYDISLEFYFGSRINNPTFIEAKQKEVLLGKLTSNILHIYGQIGGVKRPFADYGRHNRTTYTTLSKAESWKNSIHVIGEDRGNEEVLAAATKAKDWLKSAKKVFFLGYGFNDDNNKLLELDKTCMNANQVYYVNYGGSQRIDRSAQELFKRYNLEGSAGARGRANGINLFRSIKDVYLAIEDEFSLI